MKKRYIVKLSVLFLIIIVGFAACKSNNKTKEAVAHQHNITEEYTCPMHPQIVQNKPGSCPICGMDLVLKNNTSNPSGYDESIDHLLKPVNKQVVATIPTIKAENGLRTTIKEVQGTITYDTRSQTSIASRVSGRIERLLIKYNYQPVKKGQLIMELYSPDLAAAQRELIFIYHNDRDSLMLEKAKQRLLLLGMQPSQVQQVINTRKVLYRIPIYSNATGYILEKNTGSASPGSNMPVQSSTGGGDGMGMSSGAQSVFSSGTPVKTTEASPVLIREGQYVNAGQTIFTIYNNNKLVAEFSFDPSMAPEIKKGQQLIFYKTSHPEKVYSGSIGLIQPTFRTGNNFTLARVYLNHNELQVGQLVTAKIKIANKGLWVPEKAVLVLGNKSVVFKKEMDVFVPKEVKTTFSSKGMIRIQNNIADWEIASNAAYLVDSESFIKTDSNQQNQLQ